MPGARDGAINYTQLRDCYGDVYLTENKVNRVRIGLSKVPFGWDNMQSSSNRIPLDRSDPINSAINGERGTGVFYYWTPEFAQDLYKEVLDEGLKGSGNYGVFGIGADNGQGVSRAEANDNMHFVIRLELPWKMPSGVFFPFLRWQQYTGGFLWERNSPDTFTNSFDMGVEWQIQPQMEFTMEYDFANRTNTGADAQIVDANYAQFRGDLLRFQFQMNY